jgi:hypothetical protein
VADTEKREPFRIRVRKCPLLTGPEEVWINLEPTPSRNGEVENQVSIIAKPDVRFSHLVAL